MARLRRLERERGWAIPILRWREFGLLRQAEVGCGVYFVAPGRHEVTAWAEIHDWGGKFRVEVGSFATEETAKAACERDAQRRCRLEGATSSVEHADHASKRRR
jgi:hypothetical protein